MRKRIHHLYSCFRNLRLRNKLLLSYLLFFFLPMCFFIVNTFHRFSVILSNDILSSVEKNYSQTYSYLSDKIEKIKNVSDIVLVNTDINNIFAIQDSDNWQADNYYLVKRSVDFLSSLEDKDISRVILFLYQNDPRPELSYSFRSTNNVKDSTWYKLMSKNDISQLWCPTSYLDKEDVSLNTLNTSNYTLIREYNSPNDYSSRVGYFCIYFSAKRINTIINQTDTIDGSVTFLINSQNRLVYTSNQAQYATMNSYFSSRTEAKDLTTHLKSTNANGMEVIFAEEKLPYTDWRLVTVVPSSAIFSQVRAIQLSIILLTFAISILCILFAWGISTSITRRILRLQVKMKEVEQGAFVPLSETHYTDEIGMLYKSYNYMICEIERLMAEKYSAGIQTKTAEMRVLQAQVNPHFLYNTLDTIKWLVQKGDRQEAETAISALATFYKLNLSKGNDEIPLEDELRQVYSYVQIENIRFSNRIILLYDMDEEIGQYLVPKLILQPLVENSILHGIMNKENAEGSVIIKALIENGMLKISICDNGVGMTEEIVNKINSENGELGKSYGIINVQRRIRLHYGPRYGVHFSSVYGLGTTVEILLPVKRRNDIGYTL